MMKAVAIIAVFIVAAVQASDESCYKDVVRACKPTTNKNIPTSLVNCNARYGAIKDIVGDLQAYANTHIARSFEYLLMSTHFANYEKNRGGFEKLFQDLSDTKWNDAIDLIKYMTKRGGRMDFAHKKIDTINVDSNANYELYEMESLGKALDMEKKLAETAHEIHGAVTRRRNDYHDPEVSSYLEEKFVHRHADTIRSLTGHIVDLTSLLNGPDSSLALYLFDEYLRK